MIRSLFEGPASHHRCCACGSSAATSEAHLYQPLFGPEMLSNKLDVLPASWKLNRRALHTGCHRHPLSLPGPALRACFPAEAGSEQVVSCATVADCCCSRVGRRQGQRIAAEHSTAWRGRAGVCGSWCLLQRTQRSLCVSACTSGLRPGFCCVLCLGRSAGPAS